MSCDWLTIQEVADWYRVDRSTVVRWIAAGKLEASRPGGFIIRICMGEARDFGRKAEEQDDRSRRTRTS